MWEGFVIAIGNAPAGWYPTPQGDLRYWDGVQWTEHVAPLGAPVLYTRATESQASLRVAARAGLSVSRVAAWAGWGGLFLVALLGAATTGVSGVCIMAALYVLVVAVVALVRGRVTWARLRDRAAGGIAAGASMMLLIVGAATADPIPATSIALPGADADL